MTTATDEYMLGCTVPRRPRKGSRPRRFQSAWTSLVVGEHADGFHEDEREALEALCFLSSAGLPPDITQRPACSRDWSPSALSKQAVEQQAKQQHSKCSCDTPLCVAGSCKGATAKQLPRQYSPSSDVSSEAYHAALLLQDTPPTQPQEQPSNRVEDIHPAALLPNDACMTQTASTAPANNTHQQQQQQTHLHQAEARHWQQQHKHQLLEQEAPQQLLAASGLPHIQQRSIAQPTTVMAAEQQMQPLPDPLQMKKIVEATAPPPPPWTATDVCRPACVASVSAASQLCSASGVTSLVRQQLLAATTAQACGPAPANVVPDVLMQMLLSAGLPDAIMQLLGHLRLQQQYLGSVCAPQHQPAGCGVRALKFPTRGGQMHVYIAEMIAQGRRQQQQQQGPRQLLANNQQPQVALTTDCGTGQSQQQLAHSPGSALAHAVPKVRGGSPKVRPASEGTADKAKRKKQKQEQPPSAGQSVTQQDLSLSNTLAAAKPSLLAAAATTSSRTSHQLHVTSMQPAATGLAYMLPPAAALAAVQMLPSGLQPTPPAASHHVLLPVQLSMLSTAAGDGGFPVAGGMQQHMVSLCGLC